MSKYTEALDLLTPMLLEYQDNAYQLMLVAIAKAEKYEAIDNANPSEALEQLRDISYFIMEAYSDHEPLKESQRDSRQCFMNGCKNIKQALLKAQEQEKENQILKDGVKALSHYANYDASGRLSRILFNDYNSFNEKDIDVVQKALEVVENE